RPNHPVVQVAYEDAAAYAAWADASLPTEVEWERAARGRYDGAPYIWGEKPEARGQQLANYWHGDFPWRADPGYGATSPVGTYPPNDFGLLDMAGNVWEWTEDWWSSQHRSEGDCCVPSSSTRTPATREGSYDPAQPQFRVPRKVIKGGSFLCADSYCRRY